MRHPRRSVFVIFVAALLAVIWMILESDAQVAKASSYSVVQQGAECCQYSPGPIGTPTIGNQQFGFAYHSGWKCCFGMTRLLITFPIKFEGCESNLLAQIPGAWCGSHMLFPVQYSVVFRDFVPFPIPNNVNLQGLEFCAQVVEMCLVGPRASRVTSVLIE